MACDPVTLIGGAVYCPMFTLLFANASITGSPAIVFTENNESDKSSDTVKSLPLFPSIDSNSVLPVDPEPYRFKDPEASCVNFSI